MKCFAKALASTFISSLNQYLIIIYLFPKAVKAAQLSAIKKDKTPAV